MRLSPFAGSLLVRGVGSVVTFVLGVTVARVLSPADLGRYGILFSMMTIVGLPFAVGLPNFLTQELPKTDGRHSVKRLLKLSFGFAAILGCAYFVIGITCQWIGLSLAEWGLGWLSVLLLAPVVGFDQIQGGALRGLGSPNLSQIPTLLLRPFIALIVLSLAVHLGAAPTLGVALFSYAIGCLSSVCASQILLRKAVSRMPLDDGSDTRGPGFRTMGSRVGSFSAFGVAGVLTGTIDMMLLEFLGDYVGAGNYRVALQGVALVVLGHNAIGHVTYVQLAQATAGGGKGRVALAELCDKSLRWQVFATFPVIAGVLIGGLPFIKWAFGAEYSGAYRLLVILCVGHAATILVGASSYLVLLANRQVIGAVMSLIAVAMTVVVSLSLYSSVGAVAVAAGSAFGAIFRSLSYLIIARIHFGLDPGCLGYISRRVGRVGGRR